MKHFTIHELSQTGTGLPNNPSPQVIARLRALGDNVLDPLREAMGFPIRVNSGYRSPQVNRAVGGSPSSQHIRGEAADITCRDNARAFRYIKEHLDFDQLIWERGDDKAPRWIHVSYRTDRPNRKQVLRIK